MALSEQVARLEEAEHALRNLVGEIIAILRVNTQRGTLKCDDPNTFERLLTQWGERAARAGLPAAYEVRRQNDPRRNRIRTI